MSNDENEAQSAADDILAQLEAASSAPEEAPVAEAKTSPAPAAPAKVAPAKATAPVAVAPPPAAPAETELLNDNDLTNETLAEAPLPELSLEERFQGKARELCYSVLDQVLEEQLQGEFKAQIETKVKELLVAVLEEQSLSLIGGGKKASETAAPKKKAA